MLDYVSTNDTVSFRQTNLPARWMIAMSQLDIYVHITNDKRYPYRVNVSESEFKSVMKLAKEL